jgi:hypothetical protein
MSHRIKERLKTVFIYILAITGLIQVGILWSYQNQGTPTSFLTELFNSSPKINNQIASEKLFVPDRFILTDGSNSHWVISNTNSHYKELWNEASKELYQLAGGMIDIKATNEKWPDIIEKKGKASAGNEQGADKAGLQTRLILKHSLVERETVKERA